MLPHPSGDVLEYHACFRLLKASRRHPEGRDRAGLRLGLRPGRLLREGEAASAPAATERRGRHFRTLSSG